MMKRVCVFLANGFEEIEGLTVVDLLRRAGVNVTMVSIMENLLVRGAHGIEVQADKLFEDMTYEEMDMLVLPGGMPGTLHLQEHEGLRGVLEQFYKEKKYLAAICAAPTVFGRLGMLEGRVATCYPNMESELVGAEVVKTAVADADFIITSRGLGTAIDFSLVLIQKLVGKEKAEEIRESIVYNVSV